VAEALKTMSGPMGQQVEIPQMDDLDWNILEFLEGKNTFGKDWKHPDFHFGVLNKYATDTGRKLKSKYYSAISEDDYESFKRDYGIDLTPVDDPAFDAEGRLHYKELIWFKMPTKVWRSMEKINLLRANGQEPQSIAQAQAWQRDMLARSRGKFGPRDLRVNVTDKSNMDNLVKQTPVSETENMIAKDVEKMHPVEASGPAEISI
jgi:hypothetical protein